MKSRASELGATAKGRRMRFPKRHLWFVAMVAFGLFTVPAIASFEPLPVEAVNEGGGYYGESHHWSHVPQTINAGEKVTFSNLSAPDVPHGVEWRSSLKATCEKGSAGEGYVPVGTTEAASATKWSGKCTFSQPGVYTFWCTRHHQEMSGTITVSGTPKAKTDLANGENQTEAMLNGSIEPEGNAIEYHFEYGTKSLSEHTTPSTTLGATDFASHPVPMLVSGLLPGKTYHFKLVATYGAGKTALATVEQMFTTPAPTAPTVKLSEVTGLKEAEVTLNGTVDPNGGEETKYFFEYGTTPVFEKTTAPKALPVDNINHSASETLTKLTSATLYYFKLIAKNKAGEHTAEGTFKTLSPPPIEPPPPHENPSPSPSPTISSAPPAPEPLIPLAEPPRAPPPLTGLSLRASQHGPSVRGSIDVSPAGVGGRLEVALFAASASLAAAHHPAGVRVGRLLRSAVRAGVVSFAAPLSTRGRAALHRHHRLALTAQIVLTPVAGAPVSMTRSVVLRG
jgi:plastocyanin